MQTHSIPNILKWLMFLCTYFPARTGEKKPDTPLNA